MVNIMGWISGLPHQEVKTFVKQTWNPPVSHWHRWWGKSAWRIEKVDEKRDKMVLKRSENIATCLHVFDSSVSRPLSGWVSHFNYSLIVCLRSLASPIMCASGFIWDFCKTPPLLLSSLCWSLSEASMQRKRWNRCLYIFFIYIYIYISLQPRQCFR